MFSGVCAKMGLLKSGLLVMVVEVEAKWQEFMGPPDNTLFARTSMNVKLFRGFASIGTIRCHLKRFMFRKNGTHLNEIIY